MTPKTKIPRKPLVSTGAGMVRKFAAHDRPKVSPASETQPTVVEDLAQQSMVQDIDAILARLETGIAAERDALDVVLNRLIRKAA